MVDEDREIIEEFVIESRELLEQAETDLMSLDTEESLDPAIINRIFRAVHSVKGAAGFFGLTPIGELAHVLESVLMRIRDGELVPDKDMVDVLLMGNDQLRRMLEDVEHCDSIDDSAEHAALKRYLGEQQPRTAAEPKEMPVDEPADEPAESSPSGIQLKDFFLPEAARLDLQKNGKHLYYVTVKLSEGKMSFPEYIFFLAAVGDVLHSRDRIPSEESPDPGEEWSDIYIATVLEPDLAPMAFEQPPEFVKEISLKKREAPKPKAAPAKATKSEGGEKSASPSADHKTKVEESVRIKTRVLNVLMEMAGEMVLARNRLNRWLENNLQNTQGIGPILQEVSGITSSLQEEIMQMRLQPVGTLFNKFQRVVRDLSRKLKKEATLVTEGADVELDRTILEGLSDPLTHLVRNCLDHAIEAPDAREQMGKPRKGRVTLRAFHQDGLVNIQVIDDGAGLDVDRIKEKAFSKGIRTAKELEDYSDKDIFNLIFAPGFSTAAQITDVSGRGVGMDVVRTNIEKLGGTVEVNSIHGEGTSVSLKLPLTLAIVSSLIVEAGEQRFALPQVGLEEVIRLKQSENGEQIEKIYGADVLRHRGTLLPLISLSEILDLHSRDSGIQRILILRAGDNRFGLMVDQILDNEEIVVKPLSKYVINCPCFSGATILGDGTISPILDPMGIVQQANLRFEDFRAEEEKARIAQAAANTKTQSMLLFTLGGEETFAMPLSQVMRIEKVAVSEIKHVGSEEYLEYRGSTLPLLRLEHQLPIQAPLEDSETLLVIIPKYVSRPVGIACLKVVDTIETNIEVDRQTITAPGLLGSTIHEDRILLLLEVFSLVDSFLGTTPRVGSGSALLVENTPFYAIMLETYLREMGVQVQVVPTDKAALERVTSFHYDMVVTDSQITGAADLVKEIHAIIPSLSVLALADSFHEEDLQQAMEAGFEDLIIKLDREGLGRAIERMLARREAA